MIRTYWLVALYNQSLEVMKKLISIMLLGMFLLQSCTVYKGKSIALEDAYDKGKVKVHLVDGRKFKFKNLINKEGDTYGQIKQKLKDERGKKIPNYVKIYAEIESFCSSNIIAFFI